MIRKEIERNTLFTRDEDDCSILRNIVNNSHYEERMESVLSNNLDTVNPINHASFYTKVHLVLGFNNYFLFGHTFGDDIYVKSEEYDNSVLYVFFDGNEVKCRFTNAKLNEEVIPIIKNNEFVNTTLRESLLKNSIRNIQLNMRYMIND